jgi:signal transduction histidine kinase
MPPARRDLALAFALTAALLTEVLVVAPDPVSAVAALATLALAARRRHPVAVVAALGAALVADTIAGGTLVADVALPLAVMVFACLSLGLHAGTAAHAAAGTAIAVGASTLANQLAPGVDYPPLDDLVFFALILGAPTVVGQLLRRRAGLIAELDARAGALRIAREDAAAAAIAEERARLAIGVHDALAHRVGEITLQAAGAQRLAGEEPGRALSALARIDAAARGALDDIRSEIGVLRAGDELGRGAAHVPEAVPAPWEADPQPRPAAGPGRPLGGMRSAAERHGDVVLAAAVFLALAIEVLASSRQQGPAAANVLGCAAIAAPLVVRRSRPLLSAAGVLAAASVQSLLLTPVELLVTPIALLIVPTYSVAAHLPLRPALAGLALCVLLTIPLGPAPPTVLIAALAFAAGRAARDRSRRADELHEVNAELERTRDAHAARARAEERLRIARELHDAVAHRMTVIVLQAGAAQRVWGHDPAAARVAVEALTDVARETLSDLRATLRGAAPARFDQLDELVARVRPLGLDVSVTRDVDAIPADLDHPVYAVVQEALTNAARHAAPTTVDVAIRRDGDDLLVTVTDAGPSAGTAPAVAPVEGTGTGLRGLVERIEAAGGTLRYGGDGRGFRVEARLPLEPVLAA